MFSDQALLSGPSNVPKHRSEPSNPAPAGQANLEVKNHQFGEINGTGVKLHRNHHDRKARNRRICFLPVNKPKMSFWKRIEGFMYPLALHSKAVFLLYIHQPTNSSFGPAWSQHRSIASKRTTNTAMVDRFTARPPRTTHGRHIPSRHIPIQPIPAPVLWTLDTAASWRGVAR